MSEPTAGTLVNCMQVKQVSLTDFRNYAKATVPLATGKTILIGENAQGKSNFLEALQVISTGKSSRASQDADLIRWGQERMSIAVQFERGGAEESVSLSLARQLERRPGERALKRQISVNGVSYGQTRALLGHLVTVSFQSQDLNLLRGGPKYRREWIDQVILRLRPAFHDVLSSYQKVVAQRNRLLKTLFERGRLSVSDQDELLAWDKQLARFGAQIIKARVGLLSQLLPVAQENQSHLSGRREELQADYLFKAPESREQSDEPTVVADETDSEQTPPPVSLDSLVASDEKEVALTLYRLLKASRTEEIGRRQTLLGPHRDDIVLRLNDASAVDFASQGQQRSLVLSLKLAELARLNDSLGESPVLILDDVMAELDALRQRLLMSAMGAGTQTIITTTHLAGFEPDWLEDATIYSVAAGAISAVNP